jgi:hypothetical protein
MTKLAHPDALQWRAIPPHDLALYCPACGKQHLDIGEFATRVHRKHLCENTPEGPSTGCGHLWVPFPYATRGVIGASVAVTQNWRTKPNAEGWWVRRTMGGATTWHMLKAGPAPIALMQLPKPRNGDRWFGPVAIPEDK